MPFKSKAQARKFYSDPKLRKYADEWAAETPNIKSLPERKKPMAKKKRGAKKQGTRSDNPMMPQHAMPGGMMMNDSEMPAMRAKPKGKKQKGKNIAQLRADMHSANPKTRKRADFLLVARTWNKKKGK